MTEKKVSLYIHIPFCAAFCDYCDFFSIKTTGNSDAVMDAYIKSVIDDVKYQIDFFNVDKISTAYIGGGTPSVLGERRIRILLDALKSFPEFTPEEFTIEANPESVSEGFLSACLDGGINRISLGVQSFHEPSRKAVNRHGYADMLEKKLSLVSRFFPGAFSADLIAGLPFQTENVVLDDIKRLLVFKPAHVSLYSLLVEDKTPLEQKIKSGEVTLPDRDEADSIWLAGKDALKKTGFDHYEVSNFALPGKRSLHNIAYWQMESWLGAGSASSGTIINEKTGTAKRFTFSHDIEAYIKTPSIHTAACEELGKMSLIKESLLMGFRFREGPDEKKFKRRFDCGIEDCIGQTLSKWKNRDTMLFLNSFLCEAFTELESSRHLI